MAGGPPKHRANELRSKNKAELLKSLDELKRELVDLRVHKVTNASAGKLSRISVVRKNIARILTIINQNTRKAIREHYKGQKHKPLDLRPKRTRAIRRRLTERELNAKTIKQHKKDIHFPRHRNFVLKAAA
ncbi:60S ribosomal protein L35 [Tulasnella sp. 427]|nr:60S ribosomal protein L35 [Tulasnella sp. 427]